MSIYLNQTDAVNGHTFQVQDMNLTLSPGTYDNNTVPGPEFTVNV